MATINIDQLANQIAEDFETYTDNIIKEIDEAGEQIAKDAVKKLKASSPKRTGKYAKGWRQKKDKIYGQPNNYTIYNKTDYQKTHLLENGYAKKSGGRVQGQPHIRPIEEEVIEEFTNAVEEAIRNG